MDTDTFLSLVASEQERTVTRSVWVTPPDLQAKARQPGGLSMTALLSAPGRQVERREFTYAHVLGSPASEEAIATWQRQRPGHPLPADLKTLIKRINGIHLWANKETGRSYTGLAPIEEWEIARIKMFGVTAPEHLLDGRYVAVSYHQENAAHAVLDVEVGHYFLIDAAGPDATSPIARDADELLDWIWLGRLEPKE